MKLLIATDMEGISGVVSWDHVDSEKPDYSRFRKIMTDEVNAAIQGARGAGIQEIIVCDGHDSGHNIMIEDLPQGVRLFCGGNSPLGMLDGIDQGVDTCIFIGYHARAGTKEAICDHTWAGFVTNVWLNGKLVGEIGLNAAVCGHFNVPVAMLSGDRAACAEAVEWINGVQTVEVKRAVSRFAAECLQPLDAQAKIQETVQRIVAQMNNSEDLKPLQTTTPVTIIVEFQNSSLADGAVRLPGAARMDARRVGFKAQDMLAAYQSFQAVVSLAK